MKQKKRLKIALMVHSLVGGGAERVMVNLANYFADQGHRVRLLTTERGVYFDRISPSVHLHLLPFRHFSRNLFHLAWFLVRYRPDALLSTLHPANVLAPKARRLALSKTKILLREANTLDRYRSEELSNSKKKMLRRMRRAYPRADAVMANAEDIIQDLKTFGVINDGVKQQVLPNPTYNPENERLGEAPCPHPWIRAGEPYVLSVGSLTPQKDHQTLIQAMADLQSRHPMKLIILGIGSEKPRLEALIGELELEGTVSLAGFHNNPFPFYRHARLFCLSSRFEGQSNVLIEALGAGLPVVATDCPGGSRFVLDNGRYGRLVPVGDPSAMAGAMADILDKQCAFPAEAQKERARDFSVENSGRQYLDFIESVVND